MADQILTLEVQMRSAQTQRELEQLRSKATAFRKDQVIGSSEFAKAAKVEVDIKNKLHSLNVQAYSDNAKLQSSYFNLGKQLRQHKIAAVEMAGALGFGGGALGSILMALASPAGVIVGTVAALALLYNKMKELKIEAQGLRSSLAMLGAGKDIGQQIHVLEDELRQIKATKRDPVEMILRDGPNALLEYELKVGNKEKEIADRRNLQQQQAVAAQEKIIAAKMALLDKERAYLVARGKLAFEAGISLQAAGQGGQFQFGEVGSDQGLRPGVLIPYRGNMPSAGTPFGERDPMLQGTISAAESLKDDLEPIWQSIATSIFTTIGGAFAAVFAGARASALSIFGMILSATGAVLTALGIPAGPVVSAAGGFVGGFALTAGGDSSSPSHSGIRRGSARGGGRSQLVARVSNAQLEFVLSNGGTISRKFTI